MSKNLVKNYLDDTLDELDDLPEIELLRHHTKVEKEYEKKNTVRRKKQRKDKDHDLSDA